MDFVLWLRDVNGRYFHIKGLRHDIYDFCLACIENKDETEIMVIAMDGMCIYNSLSNDALDWEDLLGFVA